MKGYRFYAEYASTYKKRKKQDNGNVVAVLLQDDGRPSYNGDGSIEAIAGIYEHADSAVAGTQVSREYLWQKCRRVSEAKARQIHPRMFAWLDSFGDE